MLPLKKKFLQLNIWALWIPLRNEGKNYSTLRYRECLLKHVSQVDSLITKLSLEGIYFVAEIFKKKRNVGKPPLFIKAALVLNLS